MVGTQADNVRDMMSRGRHRPPAKITEADVAEIRRRLSEGEKQQVLADEYGIGQAQVSRIKNGVRW